MGAAALRLVPPSDSADTGLILLLHEGTYPERSSPSMERCSMPITAHVGEDDSWFGRQERILRESAPSPAAR